MAAVPFTLFFCTFFLYLRTHCATFNINDSGETILVCHGLTVGHSPGYPLHALWGRVFCLLDLGQPMFRVTLASIVSASLALVFLHLTLRTLLRRVGGGGGSPWLAEAAALFGTLVFAFSYQHWFQAGGAKGGIYTLNTLFTTFILYWVLRAAEKAWFRRSTRLMAFAYGLGLAHHWPNQVVMVPAYLWLYFLNQQHRTPGEALRALRHPLLILSFLFLFAATSAAMGSALQGVGLTFLAAGLGALLSLWGLAEWVRVLTLTIFGASAYLYLPLRAHLQPVVNWWDPDTLRRFWETVVRKGYQGIGDPRSLETLRRNLKRFGEQAVDQYGTGFTFVLYALAIWGGVALWRRGRRAEAVGLLALGFNVWAGVMVFNTPAEGYQWTLDNFFTPVFLSFAMLAAAGLFDLLERLRAPAAAVRRPVLWAAPAAVLGLLPFALNHARSDQSRYVSAYDYGLNMLRTVNRHAVIVCNGDIDILPLWYLQHVQGLRPEVASFTMQLIPYAWFREPFLQSHPELRVLVGADVRPETVVQNMIAVHGNERSFYFTNIFTAPWMRQKNPDSLPEGFLWRISSTRDLGYPVTSERVNRLWSGYRLRWLDAPERGYWDEYTDVMKDSYGIGHDFMGYLAANNNWVELAAWSFEQALRYRQEKTTPRIRFMLGQIYLAIGRPAEAAPQFERLLSLEPKNPVLHTFLGRAYAGMGRTAEARRAFETALLLNPQQAEAQRGLEALGGESPPAPPRPEAAPERLP